MGDTKTILLSSDSGYYGMASFVKTATNTVLSLNFSEQRKRQVKVYCNEEEWTFTAFERKASFVLPFVDFENVGIKVWADGKQICSGGKENEESENCESYESEEIESKKEEVVYADDATAESNFYPKNIKVMSVDGKVKAVVLSEKINAFAENGYDGLFDCIIDKRKSKKSVFSGYENSSDSIFSGFSQNKESRFFRRACYFEEVKDKIDDLFDKGEREKTLESLMPESRWVKIYRSQTQFYVVGVVGGKRSMPDYICYGLPSVFSVIPPSSLGADARWLPLDVRNPQGNGFWLIFQSARTGETVRND